MNVNRRYVWAGGGLLVVVLLVFSWWKADPRLEPMSHQEDVSSRTTHPDHIPPLPSVTLDSDCVSCPPRPPMAEKRDPVSEEAREECREILRTAAEQGIPDPDTSHLEDCGGTPLAHARTAEQVQALFDAGADPNVHGEFGRTPLSRHLFRSVTQPSEETYKIVQTMLAGGADPWMKNLDGELPLEAARKMTIASGIRALKAEEILNSRLEAQGITEAQAFAQSPEFAASIKTMRRAPELSTKTLMFFMDAMKSTNPNLTFTQ